MNYQFGFLRLLVCVALLLMLSLNIATMALAGEDEEAQDHRAQGM